MCLVAMLTLNRNPGSEEMIECVLNFDVDPFYHEAPPSLIEVSLVTGGVHHISAANHYCID